MLGLVREKILSFSSLLHDHRPPPKLYLAFVGFLLIHAFSFLWLRASDEIAPSSEFKELKAKNNYRLPRKSDGLPGIRASRMHLIQRAHEHTCLKIEKIELNQLLTTINCFFIFIVTNTEQSRFHEDTFRRSRLPCSCSIWSWCLWLLALEARRDCSMAGSNVDQDTRVSEERTWRVS